MLKRDGGFATLDAAKTAGYEDSKKMKNYRQPDRPDVGRIMAGQNAEKPTRYSSPKLSCFRGFEREANTEKQDRQRDLAAVPQN